MLTYNPWSGLDRAEGVAWGPQGDYVAAAVTEVFLVVVYYGAIPWVGATALDPAGLQQHRERGLGVGWDTGTRPGTGEWVRGWWE